MYLKMDNGNREEPRNESLDTSIEYCLLKGWGLLVFTVGYLDFSTTCARISSPNQRLDHIYFGEDSLGACLLRSYASYSTNCEDIALWKFVVSGFDTLDMPR
jgi:hypothetical protein